MNKKKLLLIIGTVLLILLIILLRPRHIKLSLSDTEDFSVVREGNEVSLTQAEKSQLIDMIDRRYNCYAMAVSALHLDGLTEYYIPARTIVLIELLCLTTKSQLSNITYRPFGKSAGNVIDYLDNIYNKKSCNT
ncbi:MAG: hypothetical protein ACLUZ6_02990 [Lachnospira eligens]